MGATLQAMYDEMRTTWEQLKSTSEVQDKELKQYGEISQETKTAQEKLNERITQLETQMKRPPMSFSNAAEERAAAKKQAIDAYTKALTKGYSAL